MKRKMEGAAEVVQRKVLAQKWGDDAIAAGYTVLPSIILRKQYKLGLDAIDVNILLHIISYWWSGGELPFPSKALIATAMQIDPSTVRRRIKQMEAGGYVRRIERRGENGRNKSNRYDLSGLIKAIAPYAAEELAEINQRQAARAARVSSKATVRLRVVK
jgi:DNA-binding MarR family transcriptional regulator